MEIKTARCVIRPWRLDDKANLIHNANNPRIARNMTNIFPVPYTSSDADGWLDARELDEEPLENYAIEIEGVVAGGIGIHPGKDVRSGTAELGYWLGENYWRQGYMTEVVKAIVPHAFECFDLHRLEAYHFGWNPASGRVLVKAGFRLEGRLRESIRKGDEVTDRVVYGLLRVDR
jgi:[ribosomal protein S5]-alanine N-acetyltransferase